MTIRVHRQRWELTWSGLSRRGDYIRVEHSNGLAIRFDDVRIKPLALPIPSESLPSDRIPIARLLPRAAPALVEGTPEPRSAKLLKSLRN